MKGRKVSSLKRRGFRVKQITHKNNTNVNKVSVNEVKSLPKGFSVENMCTEKPAPGLMEKHMPMHICVSLINTLKIKMYVERV